MNTRWIVVWIVLCGLFLEVKSVEAQLVGGSERMDVYSMGVRGYVRDSSGRGEVPFAHVFFIKGRDTTKLVASASGGFMYCGSLADTLRVRVTAVGFKPFTGMYLPRVHGSSIRIKMQQETMVLNEIIVEGKQVAMVVKGDTLKYEAEAFTTLEGDFMQMLLQKIPGVSFENGLHVNGQPIARILVNGSDSLFRGREALKHIKADNVKDIKVYDEQSKEDLAQGFKYGERKKVMDVTTKRPVTRREIRNNSLMVGGGADISKERTAKFKEKYNFKLSFKPTSFGNGWSGNVFFTNQSVLDQRRFGGDFSYAKFGKKYRYSTSNTYEHNTVYQNRSGERTYFPTERYDSRHYENVSSDKRMSYFYRTEQSLVLNRKIGTIRMLGSFNYAGVKIWQFCRELSLVDGERVASVNLSDRDQQHDSRESVSLSLEKWLPDKSNLKVMYMIELQQLKRDQWRVDTLNESTRQVFQDKGWNQNNMNLTGNVGYSKMVSPLFRLGLSYRFKYMENNARGEGWDLLKGLLDTNNTRDYTFYDYSHVGSVELKYLSKKTSVTLTVDMNYVARNHVERFPCRQQDKNNFLFLASNGHLSTTFSPVENLKVDYEVKTVLPSVEDTRRMVDDQYPLFLRAGNPNLKNTRHYTLGVQYNKTFVKRTLALEWLLNYKLIQNNIAPNSRYFMETTYLPEYDYTAVAGATLLTMENTDPWHSFGVSLKGSKRSGWLKSKLTCALSYLYEKQPSFTQGVQNDLIRNEGQFEYEVLTHFSRKVEFTLCSTTKLFREKSALDKASELLDETVRFLMRTTVIPKFRVSANLTYRYKKNFATSFETDQTALDVSVSRNIGKHTTLSLDGFNLLNMRSGVNIKKTAEYFSRSATSQTGRYVMLTLKYNFK